MKISDFTERVYSSITKEERVEMQWRNNPRDNKDTLLMIPEETT